MLELELLLVATTFGPFRVAIIFQLSLCFQKVNRIIEKNPINMGNFAYMSKEKLSSMRSDEEPPIQPF